MPYGARSRSHGLLSAWAGNSPWRRFVAWLAQSAILLGALAMVVAVVWFILTPWMIDGVVKIFSNK